MSLSRLFPMLALMMALAFFACDDNSSDEQPLPEGDADSPDVTAEAEAEEEADVYTPPEVTCDTPWTIQDGTWTPPVTRTEENYIQKMSTLIEDSIPEGGFRAISAQEDNTFLAAANDGMYVVAAEEGTLSRSSDWPQVSYTQLIGTVAVSGSAVYAKVNDQIETVDLQAPARNLVQNSSSLWVIDEANTIYDIVDTPALDVDPKRTFSNFTTLVDACDSGVGIILATDNGIWTTQGWDEGNNPVEKIIATDDLPDASVTGLACYPDTASWISYVVGTPKGLLIVDKDGEKTKVNGLKGMPYLNVRDLRYDSDTDTLYITSDKGLMTLETDASRELKWEYYHSRYYVPDWDVRGVDRSGLTMVVGTATGLGIVNFIPITLSDKASLIDQGMFERHNRYGMFSQCGLDTPGDLSTVRTHDDDNDGQWTEMYLASQSFRYAVTGDEAAREHADIAAQAMIRLLEIDGLDGFFSRSVIEPEKCEARIACSPDCGEWHMSDDGEWCWKGDTSTDEYVGHVFGLSLYYDLVADEEEKAQVREAFVKLHDGLIANGFRILDIDGECTTHCHLHPEFMNTVGRFGDGGLNSAMILGGLRAAYHMSGEPRFLEAFYYLAIDENYREWISQIQQINHVTHINHDSEEMSFLALATLIRYETDPCLMADWQEGLEYMWQTQRIERDPEFNMLYAWMAKPAEYDLDNSITTLQKIPASAVKWAVSNSHRADFKKDPDLDRFGDPQALDVFPYDQKQFPRWSKNPFKLEESGGGTQEEMMTPWLLPYWLGRYLGVITPMEPI